MTIRKILMIAGGSLVSVVVLLGLALYFNFKIDIIHIYISCLISSVFSYLWIEDYEKEKLNESIETKDGISNKSKEVLEVSDKKSKIRLWLQEVKKKVSRKSIAALGYTGKFGSQITWKYIIANPDIDKSIDGVLNSIYKKEIPEKNDVALLIGGVIRKRYRIIVVRMLFTVIVAIIAIVPTIVTIKLYKQQNELIQIQNEISNSQNDLVQAQNNNILNQNLLISSQNNLVEATRRSSVYQELSSVLDKVYSELLDSKDNYISPALEQRIIALSLSIKPYKYLNDNIGIIKHPISPERGYLLMSLLNSEINPLQIKSITTQGNFSYSDLKGAVIKNIDLGNIDLSYANFEDAILDNVTIGSIISINSLDTNEIEKIFQRQLMQGGHHSLKDMKSDKSSANLFYTKFDNTLLDNVRFHNVSLYNTYFESSIFENCIFKKSRFKGAHFTDNRLRSVAFDKCLIETSSLNSSKFDEVLFTNNTILYSTYMPNIDDAEIGFDTTVNFKCILLPQKDWLSDLIDKHKDALFLSSKDKRSRISGLTHKFDSLSLVRLLKSDLDSYNSVNVKLVAKLTKEDVLDYSSNIFTGDSRCYHQSNFDDIADILHQSLYTKYNRVVRVRTEGRPDSLILKSINIK